MRHATHPSDGGQSDICPPSHVECNGLICAVDHTSEVIGSQRRRSTVPTPSPPRSGISLKHPTPRNSRRRGTLAGWLSARSTTSRGDEHKTRPMVPPRALSTREKSNPQEFSSVIYSGQGMNMEDTFSPSSLEVRHTEDFEEDCAPALAEKPAQEGRPMSPSQEKVFHDDKYSFRQRTGGLKKWKESKSAVSDPPRRQVTFSAANVDLRIDSDPADLDPMEDSLLASPCVGTIQLSSPRYIAFQRFRKFMASQGIDAQIQYSGWVRKVLTPRSICVFVTDRKKESVIWWRYRKSGLGRGGAGASRESDLGASGCRTIPLSALASVGPAEVTPKATDGNRRFSWAKRSRKQTYLRRSSDHQTPDKGAEGGDRDSRRERNSDVPILALSYWNSGSPRWAGDQPRVLQIKLETLEAFQRLAEGLRLCCLHFFDNPWPQDLVDTL